MPQMYLVEWLFTLFVTALPARCALSSPTSPQNTCLCLC